MSTTITIGSTSYAISSCTLRTPRYGAAFADFALTDDSALAIGASATLTIGNRSCFGTVRPGSDFGGQASYSWIAGMNGWSTVVPSQPYHDDAGLMLSRVANDLAVACGETLAPVAATDDRVLGQDWTRPMAPARDLLDALTRDPSGVGVWWIDDSGTTHLGARPASSFSSSTLTVDYEPETRIAHVQLADDGFAGLLPGVTLSAPGLAAPLLVGTVIIQANEDSISADLYGERTRGELFAAMVNAVTAWQAYVRLNPYTVQSVDSATSRVAVKPADTGAAAYPAAPLLGHAPGLPGATVVLAVGAPVVVAYLEGDPHAPVVMAYPTSTTLPVLLALAASGEIDLTAPAVRLGATSGGGPVMIDPLGSFSAWLGTVGSLTGAGPPPAGITAIKVFAV